MEKPSLFFYAVFYVVLCVQKHLIFKNNAKNYVKSVENFVENL